MAGDQGVNLVTYNSREDLMTGLAAVIADDLRAALNDGDRATLAVPGGTTPGPVFDVLSDADLDWERVDIMLSDERWVPESSERSNSRLLKERLLVGKASVANFVPLYLDAPAPEDREIELRETIAATLPLSVLLVGMGEDLHTASLFPGADNLKEALSDSAPPVMAMRAPGALEPRITLTAPALKAANCAHIVIVGAGKRDALERAMLATDPEKAPILTLLNNATVHWAE